MLSDIRHRVRALLRRDAMERDLAIELELHHEREVEKLVSAGLPPDEARRRARLAMGGLERVKEETREAWGVHALESTVQDFRHAARRLRKNAGFTAAVTLSLALGIGANTAIFTLMDAVMWRSLPVSDPAGLRVAAVRHGDTLDAGFTYGQFQHLAGVGALAESAGFAAAPVSASVDGALEPGVRAHLVTGNYFGLLGVSAVRGRVIGSDDDRVPNGHPVIMLSHGYWVRRFAADERVVGTVIRLSATPFTIIGIAPSGFAGAEIGEAPDIFVPMAMQPTVMPAFENLLVNPTNSRPWVQTIVRLRPGVEASQAEAAMDAVFQRTLAAVIGTKSAATSSPAPRLVLAPAGAASELRRRFSRPLYILLAMVGVVLLIACANTANLLLARGAARRPELAMRLALGAGRRRLVRQLLVESLMLAALGGICGVWVARAATHVLVAYMSAGRTAIALDLAPNPRILAFTCAVTLLTGLLFGLAPAWRATRVDLVPALKGLRGSLSRRLRADRALLILQIALSLVLLVGAGLLVKSVRRLIGHDPVGIREQVVMMRVEPRGSDQRNHPGTTERLDRLYRALISRTETIPGVRSASMAQITPASPLTGAGAPLRTAAGDEVRVPLVMVYPRYFSTVGIRIRAGREFADGDLTDRAPAVCVVNESFARMMFGTGNPLGRSCMVSRRPGGTSEEPYQVVGVVEDSPYDNPRRDARPQIYTTFRQTNTGRGQMVLHARTSGGSGETIAQIREQVASVDPTVPIFDVHTLRDEIDATLVQHRLLALLSSVFGVLALALACVGLYGLLAFLVAERRSELGLRVALGARPGEVARLIMTDAMALVTTGVAIGVPVALVCAHVASRQVSGLLFGVEAADPASIAGAALLLAAVAAAAAWLPARRAARVDPMVTLRAE